MKPYLFLDIDGVLNPDSRRVGFRKYSILGFRVLLNVEHGIRLRSLLAYYDLVWASSWQELANEHIGSKLFLPEIPYVDFEIRWPADRLPGSNVMVKTGKVAEYARGRPFAWVDDDFAPSDLAALASLDQEVLAVSTDPRYGITDQQFFQLEEWGEKYIDSTQEADES